MTVTADGLDELGGGHFFTEVVMCVCREAVVAVDERHEGQSLGQAGELELLSGTSTRRTQMNYRWLLSHGYMYACYARSKEKTNDTFNIRRPKKKRRESI